MKKLFLLPVPVLIAGFLLAQEYWAPTPDSWSAQQIALIRSLSLSSLPPLPDDPSNAVANSDAAAKLGQHLFFETRLSSTNTVSCATCHQPENYFTDNIPLAVGKGIGTRHTPSLVGLAYSPWFYWDGRKDSQWSQALAPIEAPVEHDFDRTSLAFLLRDDPTLNALYNKSFAAITGLPAQKEPATPGSTADKMAAWQKLSASEQVSINTVFGNAGKALAAYQRKLIPGRSRFDDYADSLDGSPTTQGDGSLSKAEIGGLALFIDKAQCINCHNGPLLSNHEFHNTGVLAVAGQLPPMGRYEGVRMARQDPFNCLGQYSDAESSQCMELRFARDSNELVGAHKTPTLRNVTETAPYMHGGQIQTLTEVIRHYNDAPVSMLSHNEAKPLSLNTGELRQLEAFMATLTAPLNTDESWLRAPQAGQAEGSIDD